MYKKYPKGLKITPSKEHLVLDNLGLAQKLAHNWYNGVVDIEDLLQQAYLQLVDCATKFDETNGVKFSTYAYNCINIVLNNYVQGYNKIIKIPLNKIYKIYEYLKLPIEQQEQFKKENRLTDSEIEFYKTYEMLSMDAQIVDDYEDCSDYYYVIESGYSRIENKDLIDSIIESLPNIITNETHRNIYTDVIKISFDKHYYKYITKKYNIRNKDLLSIIETCQKLMYAHKDILT